MQPALDANYTSCTVPGTQLDVIVVDLPRVSALVLNHTMTEELLHPNLPGMMQSRIQPLLLEKCRDASSLIALLSQYEHSKHLVF